MSVFSELNEAYKVLLNIRKLFFNGKYIFLFSHMRSRSSVLSHILGSNPSICGYRELHRPYDQVFPLLRMKLKIIKELNCDTVGERYFFDKILQDCIFPDSILEKNNVKIIFLLREPESTIKSIIKMVEMTGADSYKDIHTVSAYYCARLKYMIDLSNKYHGDCFFIESDDLVSDENRVLDKLTTWLELDVPLVKEYSTFKYTGRSGHGDPSSNIKSGVLMKTHEHAGIDIPSEILEQTRKCYLECRDSLMKAVPGSVS